MSLLLLARKARIALSPRATLLRSRLNNGAIITGENRPGYGGRGVYLFRDALEPELLHLQRFLSPGDVFVDVGANVGAFTVKAAKTVGPAGVVVAVEPSIETAFRLSGNVRANSFHNVRIRNCCLGYTTKHASLYLNYGKPNSFSLIQTGQAEAVSVLTVALDDLFHWEALERLDYLKIDAEGAEDAVIAGGSEAIRLFRPIIQVEKTLCRSRLPAEYGRFVATGSPNHLLIPSEKTATIQLILSLGWARVGTEGSQPTTPGDSNASEKVDGTVFQKALGGY